MLEKIKENLFLLLIALFMVGSIGIYIFSANQYKVNSLTSENKDVIASIDKLKIYADNLYKDKLDSDTLYWQYRTAVINESQETTKEIKSSAKKMANNIDSYYRQQNPNDENYVALRKQLSTFGFTGENAINDYAITVKKETELNKKYITKHYDKLVKNVEKKSPKSIYLIFLQQEESPAKENTKAYVNKLIKKNGFKDTAEKYAAVAGNLGLTNNKGLYGYTDKDEESNDFTQDSSKIPGEIVKQVMEMKKGESFNEWVSITDSSGNTYFVKAYVDETNIKKMLNSNDETVVDKAISAFVNNNNTLSSDILDHYASKLKITYKDKKAKKEITKYLKEMRKNAEQMEEQSNEQANEQTTEQAN